MPTAVATSRPLPERALEVLRRAGNPFRNYFARNPDDEVCARYHVPELFATEREQLLGVVDLYRYDPATHSEVVPVLGNKGAGKTHLLHSIKHGTEGAWQLLVTPGTYQKDTEFLEYLLFQSSTRCWAAASRRAPGRWSSSASSWCGGCSAQALAALTPAAAARPVPGAGPGPLGAAARPGQRRRPRSGRSGCSTRLARPAPLPFQAGGRPPGLRRGRPRRRSRPASWSCAHIERTEAHNTAGLMRRHILPGLRPGRAAGRRGRPGQLPHLRLRRAGLPGPAEPAGPGAGAVQGADGSVPRPEDPGRGRLRPARRPAAGPAQRRRPPHRRGVLRRHRAGDAPDRRHLLPDLRRARPVEPLRAVAGRLHPGSAEQPDPPARPRHHQGAAPGSAAAGAGAPRRRGPAAAGAGGAARLRPSCRRSSRSPTSRSSASPAPSRRCATCSSSSATCSITSSTASRVATTAGPEREERHVATTNRLPVEEPPPVVEVGRGGAVAEAPAKPQAVGARRDRQAASGAVEPGRPVGPGAARGPPQAGAGRGADRGDARTASRAWAPFLQICHEHGVKVGPWRLQHVVAEWTFGDHPTYGVITIAHWVCKDGQPWKVGIGLFLGRGAGKPKDLETKLAALEAEPAVIDHLILLRPEDDLALTGKSKTLWQEAERRGRHARLEPVVAGRLRGAVRLPALAGGADRGAAGGPAAAEPGRSAAGEVREAAGTGVHAGAGLTS